MPQTVQIPDGTLLEFPDGMSESDMASAIYKNFPHLNPTAGFEDEAVGRSENKRVALVKQMQTERMKGMFATSLANVASVAEQQAQNLAHPIEMVEKGIEAAGTLITGKPQQLLVKPSVIAQTPLMKIPSIPEADTTLGKVGAGVGNAVIDFANFMQTPEGVAMLGIGALPEALRRGVTASISAQMAAHAPEAFNAAVEAAQKGDVQGAAKHTTEFIGGTVLSAVTAKHAVAKPGVKEPTPPPTMDQVMRHLMGLVKDPEVDAWMRTAAKEQALESTLPGKLEKADAPRTAEAVKEVMPDSTPIVDLDKIPIQDPETLGIPRSETIPPAGATKPAVPETKATPTPESVPAPEPKALPTPEPPKPAEFPAPGTYYDKNGAQWVVEEPYEFGGEPFVRAYPIGRPTEARRWSPTDAKLKGLTPKPAETPKPEPAETPKNVESMLKVEIPDVEEARARVKVADRAHEELREKGNALEKEIKEIEKVIKPQRGSAYTRSKIKATAPKGQVARYNEVRRELSKINEQSAALDESVREDRKAIDAEADAKIISDPSQSLLRRLDRQARRLDPNVPTALQQALEAETKRVILEKYPDATPEEIRRLAPDVRRSVYFQSDPWKAMDAPKLEGIRSAALEAAVNAPDVAGHMLSDELKAELDRYRKAGRTYGGAIAPDAPVEPLSSAKLVELKERIKSDAEAWRQRDAEQRAKDAAEEASRKAEEARLIAEAQKIVSTAKRVGTVGGRSAKEVKEELIERLEDKMEALVKEAGVTIRKVGEEGGVTEYTATGEGPDASAAFGEIKRSGDKYRVDIRHMRDSRNTISRTVDSVEQGEMLIKAMASTGKGHVIIAVPGDGIFRIRNEGASLLKVWNDANRLVTSSSAPPVSRGGSAEKPPTGIKTEADWNAAKEYHGLQPLDEISGWSPALAEVAKKVNPEAPEKVATFQVDAWIKEKKAAKPEPKEHARTAETSDPFERARHGEDRAFEDLDAQFREIYPEPPEFESRPSRDQVHTPQAFKKMFEDAFNARDFDKILSAIKATSDVTVWKPYLKELFAAQAKDPLAAKKAEWFRHVFNGTRPADAIPPKAPKTPPPGPSTPPPPRPGSTGRPGGSGAPPSPPPPPPAPPPPRIAIEPIPGGGAKSPFKIIEDFENAIQKAIRVRRMKPGTLGTYAPGSTQAARRFASDLDTTAHELAGHWVDDKYGIGKPWVTAKTRSPYDAELAKFWIHGSVTPRSTLKYRRAEGIAEYIRAYVVNPAMAMREAPTFTKYFESTLPPKALNAIRQFSNDVRTWAGEDPLVRAGLNIRMDPPTLRERLWNGLRGRGFGFEVSPIDRLRLWIDDPYRFAVKAFGEAVEMRGGLPVLPEHNFELLSRLLATHDSRMETQFETGLVPLKPKQKVNPDGTRSLVRAEDPVTHEPMTLKWLLGSFDTSSFDALQKDMRLASAYMVAERTLEKSKQLGRKENVSGIGAGIYSDVKAAKAAIDRAKEQPELEKRLQEAARRYRLWADHNIDMLVDAGRLSKMDAKDIRDRNEYYVDMHRLSQEFEVNNRQQRGVKIGTTRDVMKRFRGSSLELDNVYSNLLEQTDSIQKEAHRNMTMRAFTDMIHQVRQLHGPDLKEFEIFGAKARAEDRNTIRVWEDGKVTYWKFAPEIYESLKGLGELGTHAVVDFLSLPSSFTRYMVTHAPQFIARNAVRDTIERAVNSRNGSLPWDILQGYRPEELSRFKVFGGGQFGNYIVDHHVWNRELKRVSRELSKDPTNILLSPLKLKRGWENLAQASENLGRVAEFRRAFEKGKNELGYDDYNAALYAAGEARGLLDFAKAGTVMRVINRLVPFSNARLRGLIRSLETVKENPKGFALRWVTFVVLPTLLTMLWNRKDKETWDEYVQQPAYLRDFFWNFKVGDYWLRIPKPHELGVMASGVERALSKMMGEEHASEGFGKSAVQAGLPVGTPVEMTGPLKTVLELYFNRNTLTDREIVPAWEKDLKLEKRKGTVHASGIGQGLSEILKSAGMEVDPRNIDHLLQSYGGLGQIATAATSQRQKPLLDTALKGTGYFVEPPAANARDVQWVIDWAKREGHMNAIKNLIDVRKAVLDEKDPKERAEKAKYLRKMATQMREQIEAQERSVP